MERIRYVQRTYEEFRLSGFGRLILTPGSALPMNRSSVILPEGLRSDDGKVSLVSKHTIVEKDVEIPLRDGTVTSADVYRAGAETPIPATLVNTPYSKDLLVLPRPSTSVSHRAARYPSPRYVDDRR